MKIEELVEKLERYVNSGILYSMLPEDVIKEVIERLKEYKILREIELEYYLKEHKTVKL